MLGDLLPLLDQPDGTGQLALRLQNSWFQQLPGGSRWQLTASDQTGSPSGDVATALTPVQAQLLDALNAAQQNLDAAGRQVASLQWDIYALWWKLGYVTANAANPIPNARQVITSALTAKEGEATQAVSGWQSAAAQCDAAQKGTHRTTRHAAPATGTGAAVLAAERSGGHGPGRRPIIRTRRRRPLHRGRRPVLPIYRADRVGAAGHRQHHAGDGPGSLPRPAHGPGRAPGGRRPGRRGIFPRPRERAGHRGGRQSSRTAARRRGSRPADGGLEQRVGSVARPADHRRGCGPDERVRAGRGRPLEDCRGVLDPPVAPLYLDWSATYYPTSPPTAGWSLPSPVPDHAARRMQTAQWTGTVPQACKRARPGTGTAHPASQ